MTDTYIFVFGLAVAVLIGSGLSTMIVIKNRALDAAESDQESPTEAAPTLQHTYDDGPLEFQIRTGGENRVDRPKVLGSSE